ncbi:MAG: hypothetical protein AMXMBFR58_31290 [Phycisphaerae bacterium]
MAHALFTIDVWDTILRRDCHPDEVKLYVARALLLAYRSRIQPRFPDAAALLRARQQCEHDIGRSSVELGMDDEYRLDDVLERWIESVFDGSTAVEVRRVARWARDVELTQEDAVTRADAGIRSVLDASNGARRVALSDFYLPGPDLRRLIETKAPGLQLDDVVVSCDVGLNKRSGRLYGYIQDSTRVVPSQHTHIGDHEHVDVARPASMGVNVVHYLPRDEDSARTVHKQRWAMRSEPWTLDGALRSEIARDVRPPAGATCDQKEMFCFGARCAPLFVGLVLRAMEEAITVGARRVHYFTREGVFFQRVHDAIADAAPGTSLLGVPLPISELLEVSRLATFCASVQEVTTREFMRVWNLYSTQSIGNLLATLDIPEFSLRPLLEFHGIDPAVPVQYPWADPRVQALFADRRFSGTVERAARGKRALLVQYLASRGFHDDGSPKVIVDIGWRGTIQDNLAYVFPGSAVTGVYLGMQQLINVQPPNVRKIAYACDVAACQATYGPLLEHVQPLEFLTNSPDGSVRGYTVTGEGVVADRLEEHGESAVWELASRHFQRGVLAAVPTLVRWIRQYAFSSAELHPFALRSVRDIIAAPPIGLARAFFRLRHNEVFGLGEFVDMSQMAPGDLAERSRTDQEAHAAFWKLVGNSKWPCAYLRAHGLEAERAILARTRYGHVPLVDPWTTDPHHAAWSLAQIEGSRSYRLIEKVKNSLPFRVINRLRYGPAWRLPDRSDPVARLSAVAASRTFRAVRSLRHTQWARRRAIDALGTAALDRW